MEEYLAKTFGVRMCMLTGLRRRKKCISNPDEANMTKSIVSSMKIHEKSMSLLKATEKDKP
jgi:hypothetical protein